MRQEGETWAPDTRERSSAIPLRPSHVDECQLLDCIGRTTAKRPGRHAHPPILTDQVQIDFFHSLQ